MKTQILTAALLSLTLTGALAQFDSPTDELRPLGDAWIGPRLVGPPTLQYEAVPIEILSLSLQSLGPLESPPPALPIDSFFDITYTITGVLDLNPNGPTPVNGTATERLTLRSSAGGTRDFETELLQLDLTSGVVLFRESPTRASHGRTAITDLGGPGPYRIDSFFDVFTEISLDNGVNWVPQVGGDTLPGHITNTPEPSTWAAIAAVGVLVGWRWFNRRRA